jgi:hypothetical protein
MKNLERSPLNNKWKTKVSPPCLRRGGSAHSFDLWHNPYAETGWFRRNPDDVSTTSPKSMGIKSFQNIRQDHMALGTPPVQEENFSVH